MRKILSLMMTLLFAGTMMANVGNLFYTLSIPKTATADGGNASYDGAAVMTVNSMTWSLPGNTTLGDYWAVGGKSLTSKERATFAKTPMGDAIAKIVVTHSGTTSDVLYVDSVVLTVAADSTFENILDRRIQTPTITKNGAGTIEFEPTGESWAKDAYYQVSFFLTNAKTSNYRLPINKIEFYSYVSAAAPIITAENIDFGMVPTTTLPLNKSVELDVTGANLSAPITAKAGSAKTQVSGSLTAAGGTLNVTITADEEGEYADVITLSSGATVVEVAVVANIVKTAGVGTQENPFSVADVVKLDNKLGSDSKYWVQGYIVGCAANEGALAESNVNTNIALGDTASQTSNLIPVELPNGNVRTALNIVDSADHVGRQVKVYGLLVSYFNYKGVKAVTEYELMPAETPEQGDTTVVTPPAIADGYYLVGTLNNWTPAAEYLFEENASAAGEYWLSTTLALGDSLKVVAVANGAIQTWYPGGDNYVVDAAHVGEVTIYFRSEYNADWSAFGGHFYIAAETQQEPPTSFATCAAAAEAAMTVSANNELYNNGYEYTLQGYVTVIQNAWNNGVMTFWMADAADGGKVLEAYRCAVDSMANAPIVGDYVKVTGKLTKYNSTPEFAAGNTCVIVNKAPRPVTLYCLNARDWENVYAYVWANENERKAEWPGELMTATYNQIQEKVVYSYTFPDNYGYVIFNNGSGEQTGDMQRVDSLPYFKPTGVENNKVVGTWYASLEAMNGGVPLELPTSFASCAAAAEAAMTVSANNELYNDGYEYTIQGYVTLIASSWNNGMITFWMADAADGGKVLEAYKCAVDSMADAPAVGDYVKVTGKLTKYNTTPEFAAGNTCVIVNKAPRPVTLYYTNARDWENVYAYVWANANERKAEWPGEAMTKTSYQIQDKYVYSYTFTDNYGYVIFNNGSGEQTGDMQWVDSLPYFKPTGLENNKVVGTWYASLEAMNGGVAPELPTSFATCAAAAEAAMTVSKNKEFYNDGYTYSLQGYVTTVVNQFDSTSGYMTFWMADTKDGGEVLEAYQCSVNADSIPAEGDLVKVTGQLTKYNAIPEFYSGCTCVIVEKANSGENPEQPTEKATVYYVNAEDWKLINAFVWDTAAYKAWPGEAMDWADSINGMDVYAYTFPKNYANIIFNDGKNQTSDLVWTADAPYYYNQKWYASLNDLPAQPQDTTVVGTSYYLVGSFNNWTPSAEYLLAANESAAGEYVLNITLAAGDQLKVVDSDNIWYPAQGGNYEVAATKNYFVFFRPDYQGGDDWFKGCIYLYENPEQPQPAAEWDEIVFTAATAEGVFNDSIFVAPNKGFQFKCVDADPAKIKTTASKASFGNETENAAYEYRLQTSGKVPTLEFTFSADGILRMAVRAANGTDTTRTVRVTQEDEVLFEEVVKDADKVGNYYPYVYVNVKKGNAVVSTPVNGMNFYSFAFKEGSDSIPEQPEQPIVANGYYLVGTLNSWTPAAEYLFDENSDAAGEYKLTTKLPEGAEIKVVAVADDSIVAWYPPTGGNYVVDAAHAGAKTIYFRPESVSDWYEFGGYMYIGAAEKLLPMVWDGDEIVFTEPYAQGTMDGKIFTAPTNAQFSLVCHDTDINKMAVDDNSGASHVKFASEEGYTEYTYRLKTGSMLNSLTLNIPDDGILRVAARSGNNDSINRTITFEQDGWSIYERAPKESDKTDGYYPYYTMNVEAGTVSITYKGGINFYSFAFKALNDTTPEQPQDTTIYTIAGAPATVFGAEWNPSLVANEMQLNGNLYEWRADSVVLAADDEIQFKVVKGHAWGEEYPQRNNYSLLIEENGQYSLLITFDASTKEISAKATKIADAQIEEPTLKDGYYLVGGFNAWTPDSTGLFVAAEAEGEYMLDATLTLGDSIKVVYVVNDKKRDWYPAQNYVVDAAHAGEKTIYFRPVYNQDWAEFGGHFWMGTNAIEPPVSAEYYAKYQISADGYWDWAKLTKDSAGFFFTDVITYYGTGMDIATSMDGANSKYFSDSMIVAKPAISALDTVQFIYYPEEVMLVGNLIAAYAVDTTQQDTTIVPPSDHVYSVVGSEAIFGAAWNVSEGNELIKQADGTYQLLIENVSLAAGNYEYKVAIDHAWGNGEAQGNESLVIAKSGLYNIMFIYDAATPATSARAALIEELVVIPAVQIAGDFSGWKGIDFALAADSLSASYKMNCEADSAYAFKMIVGGNWLSNGYWYNRQVVGAAGITMNDNNNMLLQADVTGEYLFTWTFANDSLNILFPAQQQDTTQQDTTIVPPSDHVYSVVGSEAIFGAAWNVSEGNELIKQADGTYQLLIENVSLAAGNYEYKVAIDHAWGNGEAQGNESLVIAKSGLYNIMFIYDAVAPATSARASLIEELVIIPAVQIAGDFSGWKAIDFALAADSLSASYKMNCEADSSYTFKMIVGGNWLSNGYWYNREVVGAAGITMNDNNNMLLQADVTGEYLFTWTFANNALEITFPAQQQDTTQQDTTIVPPVAEFDTIYYVNTKEWDAVNVHLWNLASNKGTTWPGVAMTKENVYVQNYEVYSYKVDRSLGYDMCIFNNGAAQTADLKMEAGKYFCDSVWYASLNDIPEIQGDTTTIDPTTATYFIKHAGNAWTWMQMTYDAILDAFVYTDVWGGVGANINTEAADNGAMWFPEASISHNFELNLQDTVRFEYNYAKSKLNLSLIGAYAVDTTQQDTTIVPPTEHIYSVAGSEAILGSNWNEKEGNELIKQADGTYQLLIENVSLAAGNYEYKVVIDHKWNNGEAAGNESLVIAQSGLYNITFIYDAATPATSARAALIEELVVIPAVQIAGEFSGWKGIDFALAADSLSASYKMNCEADSAYAFKMIVGGNWLSNGYWYNRQVVGAAGITMNENNNMVLQADVTGEYLFTWTFANNALEITFPAQQQDTTQQDTTIVVPTLKNGYYLVGGFNAWTPDSNGLFVAATAAGEYMLEATLAEGDSMKVVKVENNAITTWYPGGANYVVDAAHAGEKTIYFRPEYNQDWAAFGGHFYIEANAVQEETITLYVIISKQLWENVFAYVWKYVDNVLNELAPWPGIQLQIMVAQNAPSRVQQLAQDANDIYTFECPISYKDVIFNNGITSPEPGEAAEQTKDLTWTESKPYFVIEDQKITEGDNQGKYDGEWKSDSATDFELIEASENAVKLLHNGEIYILRGDKIYTITGQVVR